MEFSLHRSQVVGLGTIHPSLIGHFRLTKQNEEALTCLIRRLGPWSHGDFSPRAASQWRKRDDCFWGPKIAPDNSNFIDSH